MTRGCENDQNSVFGGVTLGLGCFFSFTEMGSSPGNPQDLPPEREKKRKKEQAKEWETGGGCSPTCYDRKLLRSLVPALANVSGGSVPGGGGESVDGQGTPAQDTVWVLGLANLFVGSEGTLGTRLVFGPWTGGVSNKQLNWK